MATSVGARVELAGEREYRNAITAINAGLRSQASMLALVTAQYNTNAGSVTALTERGNVLQNQISSQRDKIEKLREALQNAATQYGESDKKTLDWQTSLNKAQTELIKMESELDDNSKELETAKQNMDKYGLSVDEVAESQSTFGEKLSGVISGLGINLPPAADKAIKALDGTKVSTAALLGVVTGIATSFVKATFSAAEYADEISELSSKTGISTDTLQELDYAADLVDVSLDTMTGSMTKMIRSMDDARKGTGDAADAFHKLHLRVTDNNGQLKDSEQMFYDTIDALGKVRNETERDAAAMAIFGKSARELNPLIEAGSERLKELGEEAKKLGIGLSAENIEKLSAFKDNIDKINKQMETFKLNIGLTLLPLLTKISDWLSTINPKTLAQIAITASIVVGVLAVVKAISSLTGMFSTFSVAGLKTTAIVVGITAALIALAAIIAVIIGKGDDLNRTMSNVGQSVGNMTNTVNGAGSRVRYSYASGIDYVPTDRVALIHRGERIVPAAENPYNPVATNAGGGDNFNLYVSMSEVDEVYKLVAVFKGMKQAARAGKVDLP